MSAADASPGTGVAAAAASTWILLRGLTRESRHWGGFGLQLGTRLGGCQPVVALDLPGNGTLCRTASPATVQELAASCRGQALQRGLQPPYVLVAMSLGAMVAFEWAHAAPSQVAGCALINTSLRGHNPFWQRLQPRNYRALGKLLWPAATPLQREQAVLHLTSADPQRHVGLPLRWAEIARHSPVSARNALRQLLAAARYAPPPGPPPVPLLVLGSAADGLVSPHCSRRLAAHWNAPLRMHPSAGHDIPLDDPEWVILQLGDWGRSLQARCASSGSQ